MKRYLLKKFKVSILIVWVLYLAICILFHLAGSSKLPIWHCVYFANDNLLIVSLCVYLSRYIYNHIAAVMLISLMIYKITQTLLIILSTIYYTTYMDYFQFLNNPIISICLSIVLSCSIYLAFEIWQKRK